jgi:hypothetical protein
MYLHCSHFSLNSRNKCKNAHSLDSPHNTALIRSVDHHELGEAELFPLLLQNDPYLMPEVGGSQNDLYQLVDLKRLDRLLGRLAIR